MLERLQRKPMLTGVAVASVVLLLVVILLPVVGPNAHSRTPSPPAQARQNTGVGQQSASTNIQVHALPASPLVSAKWSDSTVLVTWKALAGATTYQVTLIRLTDMAIMEQKRVPASQLAFDAQGIWPGEPYQVAVQPVLNSGTLGKAEYSTAGKAVPISRATYNGFLDTMNLPAGQIDTNLWNEHIVYSDQPGNGDTFINGQLHGHLAAGCPGACGNGQTLIAQNARVPLDFSGGRTLTIHGEVDLKGDDHQWFGVAVSPQVLGPDRILDQVDRFYKPLSMPQLQIFTFQGHTNLIYARGDGGAPQVLASVPNPTNINNVRDEIIWKLSSTHTTVLINGQSAFDLNWPAPLSFSRGYLSLLAEDYPQSGGSTGQPTCDQFPNDCAIWHLDNWGFDAPSSQTQPASRAYYSANCGPYAGTSDSAISANACDASATSGAGSSVTYTVNVASTANLTGARVAFDALRLETTGALTVSVNGGAQAPVPYVANDHNTYEYQSYVASIPATLLHTGSNTVTFHQVASNATGNITVANVQIETLASTPYTPPQLPPEPAPIGVWKS